MKKPLAAVAVLMIIVGFGAVVYAFRDRFNKKPTGLEIKTEPPASVFLNGKNVGTTPYSDQKLSAGKYTIRLEPQSTDGKTYAAWENRMDLEPSVATVISRSFAESETDSSGSILQLVKEPGGSTYLSVISDPDTVSLDIDGKPKGFTPSTKMETTPGSHSLRLSTPGYKAQDLTVNTVKGYNLIVNAKLAVDQLVLSQSPSPAPVPPSASSSASAAPSVSPSPAGSVKPGASPKADLAKPYVVVKDTGTGWLRVRKEPSSTADELGKADVGEKLKYLGESTETGWHKIEFEGSVGWVSGKFVDLIK